METVEPVKKKRGGNGHKPKSEAFTLCWDCALATSEKCPWADRGEPVPYWRAKPTIINFRGVRTPSYCVWKCPLFERDAVRGGRKKYVPLDGGERNNDKSVCGSGQHRSADAQYRMAITPDSGNLGGGNRPVADNRNRETRVLIPKLCNRDEMLNLAYAILERSVEDWKALDHGVRKEAMVENGDFVRRKEVARFFFSKWFTMLAEPLHYSPEEIRAALRIPPDALEVIEHLDEMEKRKGAECGQ